MSISTVQAAPDLPHARLAVRHASRRLVRTWRLGLLALALVDVAVACLMVWLWKGSTHGTSTLVLMVCVGAVYVLLQIARFVPRTPHPDPTTYVLDGDAEGTTRAWVSRVADGWQPPGITLQGAADLEVTLSGELRIGAPLVACLHERELSLLVRRARRLSHPLRDRSMRRVHRLLRGRIGFGLEPHRRWRWGLSTLILRRLELDAHVLAGSLSQWELAVEKTEDEETTRARAAQQVVAEAMVMMVDTYLTPALDVGAWHAQPFTGLRELLDAWEGIGADVWGESRTEASADDVPASRPLACLLAREPELAEAMIGQHPHDPHPTSWADHPERVALPLRRQRVAAVLEAARTATGRPQAATLSSVVDLVQGGWWETVLLLLAGPEPEVDVAPTEQRPPAEEWKPAVTRRVLEDVVALVLLDARVAVSAWSWLEGGHLVDRDGRLIDVPGIVARAHPDHTPHALGDLLRWVTEQGADPAAPLWLDGGLDQGPEVPLLAFAGGRWLRPLAVVVSNRAVHVLRHRLLRTARRGLVEAAEPLQPLLEAVSAGETRDVLSTVPLADIVAAVASPAPGGHYWHLRLRTPDSTVKLWTQVRREEVIPALAQALGDRLSLGWWELPATLRWLRNVWGYLWLAAGGVALVLAVLWVVIPPDGMPVTLPAWLGGGGAAAYVVAHLPDLALLGWRRWRSRHDPTLG